MPGGETKCCAACRTRKARQARPDLWSMRATRSYQPVTRYIMFDSAMPMAGPERTRRTAARRPERGERRAQRACAHRHTRHPTQDPRVAGDASASARARHANRDPRERRRDASSAERTTGRPVESH